MPPESLLKASVLMALYSIRSERAFCERLIYGLLFIKWFLGLRIDEPAFDATTFTRTAAAPCSPQPLAPHATGSWRTTTSGCSI